MKKKSERKLKAERELAELKAEVKALEILARAQRLKTGSTTDYFRGLLSDMNTTNCVKREWVN